MNDFSIFFHFQFLNFLEFHIFQIPNMNLLLHNLKGETNRKARFRTVVAFIWEGKEYFFEGVCEGEITLNKSGEKGFGYDPIFRPNGYDRTFAEMTMDEKSTISHRGLAIDKLVEFLARK